MPPKKGYSRLLRELEEQQDSFSQLDQHHAQGRPQINAEVTQQGTTEVGQKRNRTGEDNVNRSTTNYTIPVNAHVHLFFDGACRNNGMKNARAAYGVFHDEYSSPYTTSDEITRSGDETVVHNNAAEIIACTVAVHQAIKIVKKFGPRPVVIHGDSDHVIAAVRDGRVKAYAATNHDFSNAAHWKALGLAVSQLEALNADTVFRWVPRTMNVEADELANAALDERQPRAEIRSKSMQKFEQFQLAEIVRMLRQKRLATLRSIPNSLTDTYKATIRHIVRSCMSLAPEWAPYIISFLPHLISLHRSTIMNNDDHKTLRTHLLMLQEDAYLQHSLQQLHAKLSSDQHEDPRAPTPEERRLATFVKLGLFGKVLQDNDASPAPTDGDVEQIKHKLNDLFPPAPLPTPLACDNHVTPVTVGEMLLGVKRLRRGKAPGITGWTKELLSPAVFDMPEDVQQFFATFFTAVCNDRLNEDVRSLILEGVLLPLQYKSKPGKIRPVIMLDALTKLCWHVVLAACPAEELKSTSHTSNRKGGCQLAIAAIQAALDADNVVICMDAVNAYNTVSRQAAFDFLNRNRDTMRRLFPLVNMFYARESSATWFSGSRPIHAVNIQAGSRQGCVSGLHLLEWATAAANRRHRQHVTQVADDVTIISNSYDELQPVIADYASVNQKLDGPKMRIICSAARKSEAMHMLNASADRVCTSPTRVLGGVVSPRGCNDSDFTNVYDEIATKLRHKYYKLAALPLTRQQRWLTLLNITFHALFYVENTGRLSRRLAEMIDDLQLTTFINTFDLTNKLTSAELESLHLNLHTPIEDGGLGLLPYAAVLDHVESQRVIRVSEYVRSFGLPPPPEPQCSTKNKSLAAAWAHYWVNNLVPRNQHVRPLQAMKGAPLNRFASFLEVLPRNMYTTFDDEQFRFAVLHRLRLLDVRPLKCKHPQTSATLKTNLETGTVTRSQYTDHMQSCTSCTEHLFQRRHEAVIRSIRRVCRFHGYDCRVLSHQQRDLTLPGNSRGGADLLIYHNGNIFAIDATVVKETCPSDNVRDMMRKAFHDKKKKYERYAEVTQQVIVPFVVSVYGIVSPDTINALRPIYRVHRTDVVFRTDLLTLPQCELLKTTHAVHCELHSTNDLKCLADPTIPPPI